MGLLSIFKLPAHKKAIKDPEEISQKYAYWRMRIFIGMFFGYVFFYFTRYSFLIAKPILIETEGFSLSQLGWLQTCFALLYGASKFGTGVFADRANPRYIMGIGLLMTGVFNVFFGLASSMVFFVIFWLGNAIFQGWGWPACGRLIMHWYSKSERGRWWGGWNIAQNLGAAMIPILAGFVAIHLGWRYAMYIPGIICIGFGFVLIFILRDTPQSLGLPTVQKYRNDTTDHQAHQEEELSLKERLFNCVLKNKIVWTLAIAALFLYAMKDGLGRWFHVFLVQQNGYSIGVLTSGFLSLSFFELGGLAGSFAAGFASDCFFKGRRWPVILFCFLGALISLVCLKNFGGYSMFFAIPFVTLIGFFLYGPQILFSITAIEMVHKKAVGSITGFLGLFSYIGTALAGFPLMKLTEIYGWSSFFVILFIAGCLSVLFYLPICFIEMRSFIKRREAAETVEASA